MMNYAIETHHLKKVYKDKIVVNDVNIHVKKGEIYGFVGPNGAGKSTLMKMLLNLVQANSGEIVIFGNKVIESDFEILKRIGSIIENPYFYEKLTARENLDLHCEYMGYHNKNHTSHISGNNNKSSANHSKDVTSQVQLIHTMPLSNQCWCKD